MWRDVLAGVAVLGLMVGLGAVKEVLGDGIGECVSWMMGQD